MDAILKKIFIFPVACLSFLSLNAAPPVFELHSGFWVNLHHFLYYQALLRHPTADARRLTLSDSADISDLKGDEKRVWQSAMAFYTTNIINKDLLLDTSLVKIKNALEDKENEAELSGNGLQPDLRKVKC
jgi:hypothetical protein